jgi:hypothetical protein
MLIALIVITFLFTLSVVRLFQLAGEVQELEDVIKNQYTLPEESYRVLSEVYDNLYRVSQYSVLSDEPIVRSLVEKVKNGKQSTKELLDKYEKLLPDSL